MLGRKLLNGTFTTKAGQGGLGLVALFWKPHCATCVPPCKGPVDCNGFCFYDWVDKAFDSTLRL